PTPDGLRAANIGHRICRHPDRTSGGVGVSLPVHGTCGGIHETRREIDCRLHECPGFEGFRRHPVRNLLQNDGPYPGRIPEPMLNESSVFIPSTARRYRVCSSASSLAHSRYSASARRRSSSVTYPSATIWCPRLAATSAHIMMPASNPGSPLAIFICSRAGSGSDSHWRTRDAHTMSNRSRNGSEWMSATSNDSQDR